MSSPERLNVLLSRARNSLIMIGNSDTFTNARRGSEIWRTLLDLLRQGGHVYDGFPAVCVNHPARKIIVKEGSQFTKLCPSGGCDLNW